MKITNKDFNTVITSDENNGHKLLLKLWLNISQLNPFVKVYLGLLFISPFLAFFIQNLFALQLNYVLGSIAVVLVLILATQKDFRIPVYIYPLILFSIYYSTWDFFNGRYEEYGIIKLIFKNYTLHTIAVILIIENIIINQKLIDISLKIFKILALITIVVSLIQFVFASNFFTPNLQFDFIGGNNIYRNTSIWGYLGANEINFSFLPIMAIVINDCLIKKKFTQSFLWLVISGLVAFMTNGRYVMMNFILLLLLPIYLIKGSKIKNIAFSIISVVIVILFLSELFNLANINIDKYIEGRILSKSADSRLLAFNLFPEFFQQKPIFGSGVHVEPALKTAIANRSSQIHVGYLSALYEYGIIGSSFLFIFWFLVARKFYRTSKNFKQYGLFLGFLFFLFANLTLVDYSMFHIGIIFLFVFDRYYYIKNGLEIFYSNNEMIS